MEQSGLIESDCKVILLFEKDRWRSQSFYFYGGMTEKVWEPL